MNTPYPSEHIEQREFVSWWRKTQPDDIFAIPNGGKRGKGAAARLKLEGVKPGVWDLYAPSRFLWIEMKTVDGSLSADQVVFGRAREADGYRLMVAYGCEDAKKQVLEGERHWNK